MYKGELRSGVQFLHIRRPLRPLPHLRNGLRRGELHLPRSVSQDGITWKGTWNDGNIWFYNGYLRV